MLRVWNTDHTSNDYYSTPPTFCRAEGIIKNCNTIEDYKSLDRAAILERCAQTVRPSFFTNTRANTA
jgi:hypothetical protein